MRLAIASGKGGTGKTLVATNLATVLSRRDRPVAYLDCDVQEPSGHIVFKPDLEAARPVSIQMPQVIGSRCTHCRKCGQACRNGAILALSDQVLTFPSLCIGCGNCALVCPEQAIIEASRPVGCVEAGRAGAIRFVQGRLFSGESWLPPIIRAVLHSSGHTDISVVDAPTGISCPVVESIREADAVALVTEPSPFGLNDLQRTLTLVRQLGLPAGVIINWVEDNSSALKAYCQAEGLPVLAEIPADMRIAKSASLARLIVDSLPEFRPLFEQLADRLLTLAQQPRTSPQPLRLPAKSTPIHPVQPDLEPEPDPRPAELVVISGTGGVGKTCLTASFAALDGNAVLADCDVDTADLHLLVAPTSRSRYHFSKGFKAALDPLRCTCCGLCYQHCRYNAIEVLDKQTGQPAVFQFDQPGPLLPDEPAFSINPMVCKGCGVCIDICPEWAAFQVNNPTGTWQWCQTRYGPLIQAELEMAHSSTGDLIALVRRQARALAARTDHRLVLIDGSSVIGRANLATLEGASTVLIVAEPSFSAVGATRRLIQLTKQLRLPAMLCINKVDLNRAVAERLRQMAVQTGLPILGEIPFDPTVSRATAHLRPIVEYEDSPAAREIRNLWQRIMEIFG